MNERIRSLLDRAEYQVGKQYGPDWEVYVEPSREKILEKFAELIVRECVGICECEWNGDADTFAASEAYNECADAIKEHFGVQE